MGRDDNSRLQRRIRSTALLPETGLLTGAADDSGLPSNPAKLMMRLTERDYDKPVKCSQVTFLAY